ncbi:hypothetical protein [Enterococcus mundtii]|uniref:Uncharacterized protein n=1 Tax=Enterococcus mundtii TaxID=53346 RepID=A0A1V2UET5_ENTMU|nr:hypothetical protein [Enterococcus mundtii]ONN41846.1 hypothetical protein BTN92_11850 [Enterococcus mundtii]
MVQKYYDEFVKLPLDKMAQKMEDVTFLYNETRVPKKHYKKQLSVAVEEMIESSVEINLIETYYRTLEQLKKQNPKWLFQALVCLDSGVKPSAITPSEYQALELTHGKYLETKKGKTVSSDWLDLFEIIKENGAYYTLEMEGNEDE